MPLEIEIEETYKNHTLDRPLRSVAFRITQQSGGSSYSQIVTWTPGCVSLFGDTGNLQFQDYYAFADFKESMKIFADSEIDYLRKKLTEDYKESKISKKRQRGSSRWDADFLWRMKGLQRAAQIALKNLEEITLTTG